MNEKLPLFFKIKDNSLVFNSSSNEYINFYIPEAYFNDKIAKVEEDIISCIGLFNYARFDKNDKLLGTLGLFNHLQRIRMKPSSVLSLKNIRLTKESKPMDYRVLQFKHNDIVIESLAVRRSIEDVEVFLDMFIMGKLPNTIPYNELQNLLIDSFKLSGNNYPINIQIAGIIIGALYRDKNDIRLPYRLSKNKNMYNYNSIGIKNAIRTSSPYVALTSEYFDASAVAAINTSKEGNYIPSAIEPMFIK